MRLADRVTAMVIQCRTKRQSRSRSPPCPARQRHSPIHRYIATAEERATTPAVREWLQNQEERAQVLQSHLN